jgi:hypothetical protein
MLFSAIGDADIINPSADGFCIAVSQQLEIGSSTILFVAGPGQVPAQVRWSQQGQSGISLRRALPASDLAILTQAGPHGGACRKRLYHPA